jgi:hypothetical protein
VGYSQSAFQLFLRRGFVSYKDNSCDDRVLDEPVFQEVTLYFVSVEPHEETRRWRFHSDQKSQTFCVEVVNSDNLQN